MLGDREAMSKQSLGREGVGYNKLYLSGFEPEEYLFSSLERELSAHSFTEKEKEYEEDKKEVVGDEDEEGEGKGESERDDKGDVEEVERQEVDDNSRPFILPLIRIVNDFYPTMSPNVFNKLRDRFQIPDSIPIRLLTKHERYYPGKTTDVSMYDTMFAADLRLPLTELHRQLANYLRLSVN